MKIVALTNTGREAKGSKFERNLADTEDFNIRSYQGNKTRFSVGKYEVEITKEELLELLKHWKD